MIRVLLTLFIVVVCLVAVLANPGVGFFVLLIGVLAAWSAVRGAWDRAARQRRKLRREQGAGGKTGRGRADNAQ